MNLSKFSRVAAAIAGPALLFGAMVSPAAAAPGIDPGMAEDLIPIVLIDETILPGDGWMVTYDDYKESPPSPDTAACRNSDAKIKTLEKNLEASLAAKGKVELVKMISQNDVPFAIQSELNVYKGADEIQKALKEVKPIFASQDYVACLTTTLSKDIPGVSVKRVEPFVEAKADDPAAAFAVELTASALANPARMEAYFHVTGNTLAFMTILAPTNVVTKDDVDFIVGIQALSIEACDCGPQ